MVEPVLDVGPMTQTDKEGEETLGRQGRELERWDGDGMRRLSGRMGRSWREKGGKAEGTTVF